DLDDLRPDYEDLAYTHATHQYLEVASWGHLTNRTQDVYSATRGKYDPYLCPATVAPPAAG
ncbi:hypothetical protein ACLOJK_006833, partial [Asimina triloba]